MAFRSTWSWSAGALLCSCLIATPLCAEPSAGEREAARQLGSQGTTSFQAGDYATAAERLERAYAILPAPSLGLWRARALVKLGRLLSASEQYLAVTRLEVKSGNLALQRQAQAEAQTERAALLLRIPSIELRVEGANPADVALKVDGAAVSTSMIGERFPVDPGRHTVEASLGAEHAQVAVEVKEGQSEVAKLVFNGGAAAPPPLVPPPPPPVAGGAPSAPSLPVEAGGAPVAVSPAAPGGGSPPAPAAARSGSFSKPLGWAAVGVGGVGVGVGVVAGVLVLKKRDDLEGSPDCRALRCLPSQEDEVNSYNLLRTVSTGSLVAGGLLLGAGVTLLLLAPKHESPDSPSVAFGLAPQGFQARGRF